LTLRIEKISERRKTRIRLCGEFRAAHIDQVKAELRKGGPRVALDLDEVDLIDVECIRFLNACEAEGISALHCSPYIKTWMSRERGVSKRRESRTLLRKIDNIIEPKGKEPLIKLRRTR